VLTSAKNNAIFKTEMEVLNMVNTNLNIRTDKEVKNQAEKIFNALGMNMTTAVNIFLKTTIRENGIPFRLTLDVPNATTRSAIEEGKRIAIDKKVKGYTNMTDLRVALEK
jgi:DNA-damage-inducible protein J